MARSIVAFALQLQMLAVLPATAADTIKIAISVGLSGPNAIYGQRQHPARALPDGAPAEVTTSLPDNHN